MQQQVQQYDAYGQPVQPQYDPYAYQPQPEQQYDPYAYQQQPVQQQVQQYDGQYDAYGQPVPQHVPPQGLDETSFFDTGFIDVSKLRELGGGHQ